MEDPNAPTRITPETLAHLREWEGRTQALVDQVTSAPVHGLAATLDQADVSWTQGAELPPLWHWLYFLPKAPHREIGADGHPRPGSFLPPVPLPRRMWAGGRLRWHAPLHIGDTVQRTTRIVSVDHKPGRTGDLVFVLLRHEITRSGSLVMTEEHDIVYRAGAQRGDPVPKSQAAPTGAIWSRSASTDVVQLFRYSALTFNAHRIHYDRPYATQVEGYAGLVVHGPLLATLLIDLAHRACPETRIEAFSFRAVRPTLDQNSFRLCGIPVEDGTSAKLWAQDHEGWLTMNAHIQFAGT